MTQEELFEKIDKENRWLTYHTDRASSDIDIAFSAIKKYVAECLSKEQEPCEDAISRQAVLDIVNIPLNIRLDEIIKKLPSVNLQEPKTGHWEIISGNNSRCSICGVYNPPDYFNRPVIYNYCPFCGAKMEG